MGPPRLRGGASVCPAPTSAPPDLGLPCFEWRPANDRCWTLGKSTDGILPTTSQKASCLTGKLSGVLTPKGHVHRCRPSSIPFQSQMKPWDPVSDTSPLRLGNDELGGSHLPLPERCPPPDCIKFPSNHGEHSVFWVRHSPHRTRTDAAGLCRASLVPQQP